MFSLVGFFQRFVLIKWFQECCGEDDLQSCDNTCLWFTKTVAWAFRAVERSHVGGMFMVTLWYTILTFMAIFSYLFTSQYLLLTLCCWALSVAYIGCDWSGTKWKKKMLHKTEVKIIFTESCLSTRQHTSVSDLFYNAVSGCQGVMNCKADVWLTVHRNSVWIRKTN